MLTKEDKELLCWIGNRLAYKYGEDEQIIAQINDIISRDKIFSEVIASDYRTITMVFLVLLIIYSNLMNLVRNRHDLFLL